MENDEIYGTFVSLLYLTSSTCRRMYWYIANVSRTKTLHLARVFFRAKSVRSQVASLVSLICQLNIIHHTKTTKTIPKMPLLLVLADFVCVISFVIS